MIGISAICCVFPAISSCKQQNEPALPDSTRPVEQKTTPLEHEIAKMIRQEPHDMNLLKSLLKGKTWEEVEPIISATEERIQKETGAEPDRKAVVKTILKIQTVIDRHEIEASKARHKETLRKITKELQEMAEEEGLLNR